jgi:hypothetical protein
MTKRRSKAKAASIGISTIGPGNPPKHTQFQKGTSGNLKGRPKGSKNLSTTFMEAARHPVTVTLNGKERTVTAMHATTLRLAEKAAGGDARATAAFLDWIDEIEKRAAAAKPAAFSLSEADVEVLRAAYERMSQCDPDSAGS